MWFLRQIIYLFKVLFKQIFIKAFFYIGPLIHFHLFSIHWEKFHFYNDQTFWNIMRYETTHMGGVAGGGK